MDRKGQAAMEFLMTYGWAILAAIIAIGVLAYYGIFSPGKFVTNAVIIQAPFGANGVLDEITAGNQEIKLELRNGAGQLVTISALTITGCTDATVSNSSALLTVNSLPDTIAAGDDEVFTLDCTETLASGSTFKGDIKVTYMPQDSTLPQTTTGSITHRVP